MQVRVHVRDVVLAKQNETEEEEPLKLSFPTALLPDTHHFPPTVRGLSCCAPPDPGPVTLIKNNQSRGGFSK